MCTAVDYKTDVHYFGRNLDLEGSLGEEVTISPRRFPFRFRCGDSTDRHYAIIGMAHIADGYPLYYDGVNEKGLAMAGLNFPHFAHYYDRVKDKCNIAPFELIPLILSKCSCVKEAKTLLADINLYSEPFSSELPLSPLHWIISDKDASIVAEPLKDGLAVWDNPTGILTNSPPFDIQLINLSNYMGLTSSPIENRFSDKLILNKYSRGMGAMGLPGDPSSGSRFVRAVFTKFNSIASPSEQESLSQFFHILSSVEQQRGCVRLENGLNEYTRYSSCCNTANGIYYYKTYDNSRITAVNMHRENLDTCKLISYPLLTKQDILLQNP